ncbi:MAG: protein-glutamate O-methyltransferase CheR [Saprospirales bacterium]|nr:protein-glutamate O-methyltransferase CheR [Saprospirales bacterium]
MINVTSFFRETDTYQYLKTKLLPKLLKEKKPGESLRVWVPACSSGEEAYSMAIMLLEIQDGLQTDIPIQLFATDLSEQAIGKARAGLYTKKDLELMSPLRIQRFFTKTDGDYRITKSVRDICIFAPHNILTDPPFSRLDFISCCNLFIYLDTAAQKKAVRTFHYALNEGAYLMVGKSESIGTAPTLFEDYNKKFKIYVRKNKSGESMPGLSNNIARKYLQLQNTGPRTTKLSNSKKSAPVSSRNLESAIDAILISNHMPATVVINYNMDIQQFRGTTDFFLTHPAGKATFNILKMARPEIAFELRTTISNVIKNK